METYSTHMEAAVRQQLRQASSKRLEELLTYYHRRGGPGLRLAQLEQADRLKRQQTNYPPQAA